MKNLLLTLILAVFVAGQSVTRAEQSWELPQAVRDIDAQLAQMEDTYQRLLPHAKEDYAVEQLTQLRAQANLLMVQRNQVLLNESITRMAISGDPTYMMDVMAAMGHRISIRGLSNGKLQIIGVNGKPMVEGSPQEIADYIRGNLKLGNY